MNLQRRSFLLAAAAAARAASAQSAGRTGTGMIGTGNRGSYLLSGVLKVPTAKVVAVCDIKPERLDKAASAAAKDNPTTTSDWRRIIDNKEISAVFIATPPYLHAEMAIAAIQAGKHVYCEKPIGMTGPQVRDLLAAARKSKKVFLAGQQLRSMKLYQEAVRKIHAGAIGDVVMVKAQRHATADLPHDGSSGDWYFDVAKSGGYLIEQSVHNLDLCNWVIGGHPTRAAGFGAINFYRNQPAGRTIFDCGSITFDYANGVKMSFTQNVFHPRAMPAGGQYINVYGTKGAVDLMATNTFYPLANDARPEPFVVKQEEDNNAHIATFFNAILNGGELPSGVAIGATAALTAILGHEAMVKQSVVNWSDFQVDL